MKARVVCAWLAALLCACQPEQPSFVGRDVTGLKVGRDFHLVDPDGKTRALADFHGQVVLLFFGFTQCPDVCPTALARAAEAKHKLGADSGRLQVIFVTVDPERDKPALLKAYTAAFDRSFIGLSTSPEETRKTADAFGVFYQKVPTSSSYTVDHTAISFVFDATGALRLAVPPNETADQLAADIEALLKFTRHT
jgi:protein SCO1/2